MKNIYDIVHKPVISEKSFQDAGRGLYTFVVNRLANKNEIKDAVEKLFGVEVEEISTNNTKKTKNILTRTGRRSKETVVKKARVRLKKGQKIDLFEEEGV